MISMCSEKKQTSKESPLISITRGCEELFHDFCSLDICLAALLRASRISAEVLLLLALPSERKMEKKLSELTSGNAKLGVQQMFSCGFGSRSLGRSTKKNLGNVVTMSLTLTLPSHHLSVLSYDSGLFTTLT